VTGVEQNRRAAFTPLQLAKLARRGQITRRVSLDIEAA
jgi:hypothetical protein